MTINPIITENLKNLTKVLPIQKAQLFNSEITIVCKPKDISKILSFFKNQVLCQFKILTCISCVDYPQNKYRFKIVYELLSVRYNSRLRVAIFVDELTSVDSSDGVFSTSSWYESEIWDMFGIFFKNHTSLKRILTDYGFEGYPLRKDFPLSGFVEMKYNEVKKRVISEPIEFSQEYRAFKFLSPWEN